MIDESGGFLPLPSAMWRKDCVTWCHSIGAIIAVHRPSLIRATLCSVSAHWDGEKKERVERRKKKDERREPERKKEQRREGGWEVSVRQEAMKRKKETVGCQWNGKNNSMMAWDQTSEGWNKKQMERLEEGIRCICMWKTREVSRCQYSSLFSLSKVPYITQALVTVHLFQTYFIFPFKCTLFYQILLQHISKKVCCKYTEYIYIFILTWFSHCSTFISLLYIIKLTRLDWDTLVIHHSEHHYFCAFYFCESDYTYVFWVWIVYICCLETGESWQPKNCVFDERGHRLNIML